MSRLFRPKSARKERLHNQMFMGPYLREERKQRELEEEAEEAIKRLRPVSGENQYWGGQLVRGVTGGIGQPVYSAGSAVVDYSIVDYSISSGYTPAGTLVALTEEK